MRFLTAEGASSRRARNIRPRSIAALRLAIPAVIALAWVAVAQSPPPSPPALAPPAALTAPASVVVVVRHGEKDPAGDPRDPGLSESGRARALRLAQMIAPSAPTHFFSTELRRTRETVAPLAETSGGEVTVVPARETAVLIDKLKALAPGTVAVVAGHSNTVPAIVRGLGGDLRRVLDTPHGPALDESEFGRIFVVTRIARAGGGASDVATFEIAYPE